MNVLVPALALVSAAFVTAVGALIVAVMQVRTKPSRQDERARSRERRILELERDGVAAYEHNERLEAELRSCRAEVRRLDELLYKEQIGHAIAERKLAAAVEALERLTGDS